MCIRDSIKGTLQSVRPGKLVAEGRHDRPSQRVGRRGLGTDIDGLHVQQSTAHWQCQQVTEVDLRVLGPVVVEELRQRQGEPWGRYVGGLNIVLDLPRPLDCRVTWQFKYP